VEGEVNGASKAVRNWQWWSDVWISSSLLFLLVSFLGLLVCLRALIDAEFGKWFEANSGAVLIAAHSLYIPLAWTVYCGHRMSKAREATQTEAASVAREFDA
jgi:hypothetical protein